MLYFSKNFPKILSLLITTTRMEAKCNGAND